MRFRKTLLIAAVVLFVVAATGIPLAINAVPLGLACFAGASLYTR